MGTGLAAESPEKVDQSEVPAAKTAEGLAAGGD